VRRFVSSTLGSPPAMRDFISCVPATPHLYALSLHDALPIFRLAPAVHEVPVREAAGRVLASAVRSPEDVPAVAVSAMDGFAETRSEEHTSELQSRFDLVCRPLIEKTKKYRQRMTRPESRHRA